MRCARTKGARGVARVDAIAVLACVGFLGAVGAGADLHPRSVRDAAQLRQIHVALATFARDFDGLYPSPGRINRRPVDLGGQLRDVPGRGEPDTARDTTANLYSALIMTNYFTPRFVVSPVERNPNVEVHETYDWAVYSPIDDVYWDEEFKADLQELSHVSYAHLVLYGKRIEIRRRDPDDAAFPVLGNRGPRDGRIDPRSYTCGPHGHWTGHIVYNDGRVVMERTTAPEGVTFFGGPDGVRKPDNLFAFDDGVAGVDAILTFTKRMTDDGPVVQFD